MKRMILATLTALSFSVVAHADRFDRGWGRPGPGYGYGHGYGRGVPGRAYKRSEVILLGTTRITGNNDFDVIYLRGPCFSRQNPGVKAVQVRVVGRGANLDSVTLRYENGAFDYLPVGENLFRNPASRWIDVPGRERCIREIRIQGDSYNWRGGDVQVWGLTD